MERSQGRVRRAAARVSGGMLYAVLCVALCVALCAALCACARDERAQDLFGYQRTNGRATVYGRWQEVDFAGELLYIAPAEGAPAAVALTFREPAAWRGITLTLVDGEARMALGAAAYALPFDPRGTWFELPAMYTACGAVQGIRADDGETTCVTVLDAHGAPVSITLDGASGRPRRLERAEGWMVLE